MNRTLLIAGGVGVAAIAAYFWWQSQQAAAAAALPASTDTSGTDTSGTDTTALPSPYTQTTTGEMSDAPDYANGDPYGEPSSYGGPAFPIMRVAPPARPSPVHPPAYYDSHPLQAPPGYWLQRPALVRQIVQQHPAWKAELIRQFPALKTTLGRHHRRGGSSAPYADNSYGDDGLTVYDDSAVY